MKKLTISLIAVAVLIVGALTALAITSSDTSAAQASEATDQANDTIDGLVDAGIIGDTLADFLHKLVDTAEDSGIELPEPTDDDAIDPDELKQYLEDFDFTELEEMLSGLSQFDFESFDFGEFDTNGLGEGFGEGFAFDLDLADLLERFGDFDFGQFGEGFAFDFDGFEEFDFESMPKFDHPPRFGHFFGHGPFGDLDPDELREAFENDTLDDLIDWDAWISEMLADAEARLDAAVDAGKLTRAEADEKLDLMRDHLEAMRNGEFHFFNHPMHGSDA